MSQHNLPQPLPGAPALRAHLKALERGVAEARTQRLGDHAPTAHHPKPGLNTNAFGGMIGGTPTPRANTSPYLISKNNTPVSKASSSANGKPRAARAKSSGDFGAFFDSIEKRAAS
jgi:hypothetical protein